MRAASAYLGHLEGGARATRVYDRYSYDNEKRAALKIWARRLHAILKHQGAAKVLAFGSAKGAGCDRLSPSQSAQ